MRLVILCEGHTEQAVLRDFLAPYCTEFEKVEVINMSGAARLKTEFKYFAELELHSNPSTFVLCLIDLYNAPFSFPKSFEVAEDPFLEQYAYVQKYMQDQVDQTVRDRFFAFPIVMELETWLLADEEALRYFDNSISVWHTPESQLRPSEELKRLMKRVKGYDYDKRLHGKLLFSRASANRVYEDNCPHFEAIINQLLTLQNLPLPKQSTEYSIPNQELFNQLTTLQNKINSIWSEGEKQNDFTSDQIQQIELLEKAQKEILSQISSTEV